MRRINGCEMSKSFYQTLPRRGWVCTQPEIMRCAYLITVFSMKFIQYLIQRIRTSLRRCSSSTSTLEISSRNSKSIQSLGERIKSSNILFTVANNRHFYRTRGNRNDNIRIACRPTKIHSKKD